MLERKLRASKFVLGVVLAMLGACDDDGDPPHPRHDAGIPPQVDAAVSGDAAATDAAARPECDVTAPTQCPKNGPHYADVKTIIASRCLGCHDGKGLQWPLTSYSHVADWYQEIRAQMLACTMPPPDAGIAMPSEERERILLWIRCGYPQ